MFCHLKLKIVKKLQPILSSKCGNERLKCYDHWKKFLWSANKNDLKTHDNIKKIAIGHGDNYKTGCLLDYPYFKKYYKLITIDLSKQQKLDTDPKAIQQINYTGSLSRAEGKTMFFIIEEAKEAGLIIQKEKL